MWTWKLWAKERSIVVSHAHKRTGAQALSVVAKRHPQPTRSHYDEKVSSFPRNIDWGNKCPNVQTTYSYLLPLRTIEMPARQPVRMFTLTVEVVRTSHFFKVSRGLAIDKALKDLHDVLGNPVAITFFFKPYQQSLHTYSFEGIRKQHEKSQEVSSRAFFRGPSNRYVPTAVRKSAINLINQWTKSSLRHLTKTSIFLFCFVKRDKNKQRPWEKRVIWSKQRKRRWKRRSERSKRKR